MKISPGHEGMNASKVGQAMGGEHEYLAFPRGELPHLAGVGGRGSGRVANSRTTRRVTDGDSSASPAATSRIARSSSAGLVSLMRNPLAPWRSASNTYSSSSNVVSTTTRVPSSSGSAAIRRVASMPSMPGIRTSISTTSGR